MQRKLKAWTQISTEDILKYDRDKSGEVDKNEFVLAMLETMGNVDEETINTYAAKFDEFDLDNSGSLDKDDIAAMQRKQDLNAVLAPTHPPCVWSTPRPEVPFAGAAGQNGRARQHRADGAVRRGRALCRSVGRAGLRRTGSMHNSNAVVKIHTAGLVGHEQRQAEQH